MDDFSALVEFCNTRKQTEILQARIKTTSNTEAAKALGVNRRYVDRTIKAVKARAAKRGHSPAHDMTHTAPEGFNVLGTSTLYDAETGEAKIQWVKTAADKAAQLEQMRESLETAFEDIKPLKVIKKPTNNNKELLAVYPLGDPHLGMYAWADEAGEDFDIDIAAKDLYGAVDRLVATAPGAKTALLLNLGDFFHADNVESKTRRSGNVLDVDTRWARVLDIGMQTVIRMIRRMLEKHETVIVRNNIGNHDEHTSIMLSIGLNAFFRNNKRVTIDTSPNPFWYYQHGKVLIGSTHGDRTKPADLEGIMAADRSEAWGLTTNRYWYKGHFHHKHKTEFRGCIVEGFRTLAPGDAWHHGQGYRTGRDMYCIVHHKEFGELERHRIGVEQL